MPPLLHAPVYFASLALFGGWTLAVNVTGLVGLCLPRSERREAFFRRLIQQQVRAFLRVLRALGAVHVEYRGWENVPTVPAVVVANHPGLLDALYLLAREPDAFCIFKRAIGRSPWFGAVARSAGHLPNDGGLQLVRGATAKLRAGASLVVFPEGTRTPVESTLGSLRPGFAAIARRAGTPVQLVRITTSGALLTKAAPWWKVPQLPVLVVVEAGPRLDPGAAATTAALVCQVQAWLRDGAAPTPELTPLHASPLTIA
jgi:1-acyl-sn-glycerol-3-phosphate acyltransferase